MPRFADVEGMGVLEFPDDTSDEVMDTTVKRELQAHQRKGIRANTSRLQQSQMPPQTSPVAPGSTMAPGTMVGPEGTVEEEYPLAFMGDVPFVMDPQTGQPIIDPARKAIARALPSMVLSGVGGAVAGPPGAAAGAGAGEAITQAGTRILGALGGREQGPPEDVLKDVGISTALGYVGEILPAKAIQGIGKILAPFAKKITPEGFLAMKELGKVGVRPTPGRVGSRGLGWLENITESAIGGGGVTAARETAEEAGTALLKKGLTKPGTAAQTMRTLGGRLEEMGGRTVLDVGKTQKAAAELLAERGLPKGDKFKDALEYVAGLKEQKFAPTGKANFKDLQRLRSDLQDLARTSIREGGSANERGSIRLLAKTLKSEMEEGLAAGGHKDLLQTWNKFNKASRVEYSRRKAQSLIEKSAFEKGGEILYKGSTIRNRLAKMSPEDRAEFHPAVLDRLDRLSKVLATVQPESVSQGFTYAIRGIQVGSGGLLGFLTGSPTAAGTAALGLPKVVAWGLTSPKTYRWLTTGLAKPNTPQGQAALTMLIREYMRDNPDDKDKQEEGE